MRTISNGSNTFAGMQTRAILGSIVQTSTQRDTLVLSSLQSPLHQDVQEFRSLLAILPPFTPLNLRL